MPTGIVHTAGSGYRGRFLLFLRREFREILPPTLFFFVGFNLILFTKRLILEDYLIQYTGFFIATTAALIVGKSVLVANTMPFLRRFDNSPLVYPILFKTLVYTLFVFVARLIEALLHYLVGGGALGGGRLIADLLGTVEDCAACLLGHAAIGECHGPEKISEAGARKISARLPRRKKASRKYTSLATAEFEPTRPR